MERFDPANPQAGWQAVASLPQGLATQSVSCATDSSGRIHALVGPQAANMCIRYDALLDQWDEVLPLPNPMFLGSSSLAFDPAGRLWLVGAYPNTTPVASTWMLTGLAAVTYYGHGCMGTSGVPSLMATLPILGHTTQLACTNLVSGNLVFLTTGFDNTRWNGVPLPLNLALIGMPGCNLYSVPSSLQTGGVFAGFIYFGLAIPNNSNLAGAVLHAQILGLDLQANEFGGVTSNAIALTVGI